MLQCRTRRTRVDLGVAVRARNKNRSVHEASAQAPYHHGGARRCSAKKGPGGVCADGPAEEQSGHQHAHPCQSRDRMWRGKRQCPALGHQQPFPHSEPFAPRSVLDNTPVHATVHTLVLHAATVPNMPCVPGVPGHWPLGEPHNHGATVVRAVRAVLSVLAVTGTCGVRLFFAGWAAGPASVIPVNCVAHDMHAQTAGDPWQCGVLSNLLTSRLSLLPPLGLQAQLNLGMSALLSLTKRLQQKLDRQGDRRDRDAES